MALVNCPECNSQISDQAPHCPACGAVTSDTCPECGATRALQESYCARCGFPRDAASPSVPGGEDPTVALAPSRPEPESSHEDELLAACIGPNNTDYYVRMFEQFRSGRGAASWNWPAFFLTIPWLLYRKMWGLTVLYWFGLPIALVILTAMLAAVVQDPSVAGAGYYLSYLFVAFVLVPIFANTLYYGHVNRKIQKVKQRFRSPDDQLKEMYRIGGTSGAGTAAVVILLVIIPLIGIIAAISIPAYQDYTIRAQVSEGLNLSAGAKAAVTEYFQDRRQFPADNVSAGVMAAETITGKYVSRVTIDNGMVIVTYGNNANENIHGRSIVMEPDASAPPYVHWVCYSPEIENKWLPAACRGN